jgi:hypothetical protein
MNKMTIHGGTAIQEVGKEKRFKLSEPFGRRELYDALRASGRALSYNSVGGVIVEMMSEGEIERVGRNRYAFFNGRRVVYAAPVSEQLSRVIASISERFPILEFLAWDTTALNEFLNHQIANGAILLEVEAMLESAVFEYLREEMGKTVLLKPNIKSFNTYWEPGIVIVQRLTSQAPGDKAGSHLPSLEKLVVDLFANKLVRAVFSQSELPSLLEQMFERYVIDESRLFRYACRRNRAERIEAFIKDKTNIVLRTR